MSLSGGLQMKRYKMDKWGQLPFFAKPTEEKEPWTVRSIFLTLIPIVMLIALVSSFFFHQ
jgi:hypothetical protein